MDLELIKIARTGDVDELTRKLEAIGSNILHQVTPVGNTLLHLVAQFGKKDVLQKVCELCPSLINMKNRNGDTALHVAAIAGNVDVIKHLIEKRESCESFDLLMSQNYKGDTALHQALRLYDSGYVAGLLIQKEPRLCRLVNKASESPLFMAAMTTRSHYGIVTDVLKYCPSPAFEGPKGWTALHASVVTGNDWLTKKLVQAKPQLGRMVDIYGRSPLHYAVDTRKDKIVKILLQSDPSAGYIQDKRDGWSPLHVAANNMSSTDTEMVEDLINYCPDLEYVRDNRGNNFLHVLIERVEPCTRDEFGEADRLWSKLKTLLSLDVLLRQPNNDGNTPLHLAFLYDKTFLFNTTLLKCTSRSLDILWEARNNSYLTPHEIKTILRYSKSRELAEQDKMTVPNRNSKGLGFLDLPLMWIETLKNDFDVMNEDIEGYRKRSGSIEIGAEGEIRKKLSKTHTLVATLIATIAFAAALQIPGGYNGGDSGNKKAGMAVLAGEAAFQAFIISDVTALSSSLLLLLLYFFSQMGAELTPTYNTLMASSYLMLCAIIAMLVAFPCGLFAVLVRTHSSWIGILTLLFCLSVPFLGYFLARTFRRLPAYGYDFYIDIKKENFITTSPSLV